MKKIKFIVLSLFLCWAAKAQDLYYVQQIKGSVIRNGTPVKVGDKILSTDKVKFSTGAVMMVSHSDLGRHILPSNPQQYSSETYLALKDYFPKSNKASAKSNLILANLVDFNYYFGAAKFRVYGEETSFEVSPELITLNEKNFPFLRFKHPSEAEPVNKKISFQGQKVFLNKKEIFQINGKAINQEDCVFEGLYFYEEGKTEFSKISGFQLVFVEDAALQEHATNLISLIDKNQVDVQLYNNLYNALFDFALYQYGEVPKDNLEYWIQNKLGISRPDK